MLLEWYKYLSGIKKLAFQIKCFGFLAGCWPALWNEPKEDENLGNVTYYYPLRVLVNDYPLQVLRWFYMLVNDTQELTDLGNLLL